MNEPLPLIVANFKANKNWDAVARWLDLIGFQSSSFSGTIIVCPSAPFLAAAHQMQMANSAWRLQIGIQDLSQFEQGAYTGEVAASQISNLVKYAVIGHSERRQHFGEGDPVLATKVDNATKSRIEPIFCVQDENTAIPTGVKIVAYEPVFAIGTGNPDSPENAQDVSQKIIGKGDYIVLYGGSVTDLNIKSFLKEGVIDGALIATSSLDPQSFIKILEAVKS